MAHSYRQDQKDNLLAAGNGPEVVADGDDVTNLSNLVNGLQSGDNSFDVVNTAEVRVESGAPANAAATGTVGSITWDTGFIYVCTATNTWKRVAIATW
jgi:hypothetical protein